MFWWVLEETGDLDLARTVAMTQMVVFQFFHVFNCRSLDRSIFAIPPFGNKFLFASVAAALSRAHFAVLHSAPLQTVFRHPAADPRDLGLDRPRRSLGGPRRRARQGLEPPGTGKPRSRISASIFGVAAAEGAVGLGRVDGVARREQVLDQLLRQLPS
jgi:hypothetical protein